MDEKEKVTNTEKSKWRSSKLPATGGRSAGSGETIQTDDDVLWGRNPSADHKITDFKPGIWTEQWP